MAEPSPQVFNPAPLLARELSLAPTSVAAVVHLLSEGATVPFIARYRKEATGSLDEVAIRAIDERGGYLRELEERRQAVREIIAEQGKLTPELDRRLGACTTKTALEDLYLPYKKKRRTRATVARERGLEPLATRILEQPLYERPEAAAQAFVNAAAEVPDVAAALAGARDIVAEHMAEEPDLRAATRDAFHRGALLVSKKARKAPEGRSRFEDYTDFSEAIRRVPSHRYLAMRRGEREGVLSLGIKLEPERILPSLLRALGQDRRSPFAPQLDEAALDGFKRLLAPSLESELHTELKARADEEAIAVFAANLRHLLSAAPYGGRSVLGIDPGLRTGCKLTAVDATGAYLGATTIYPHAGGDQQKAGREFLAFLKRYPAEAIAVGNGTGGRETEAFVRQALKDGGTEGAQAPMVVLVSEAGASVYSASEIARAEFPDLDLTLRGAISIARRLQDPLAELVKIEAKAIGVGQYQHDVDQKRLQQRLDAVVESVVNEVGVELNTASAALLAYVAGVGPKLATAIVSERDKSGGFRRRRALLDVKGLGPKAYQQAAGFLRVRGGEHPLDASAVHPERYALVEGIARDLGVPLARLVGDASAAARIDLTRYVSDEVGLPTLTDIVAELAKPGRDPRDAFEAPAFREDVNRIEDLQEDMELQGVVTNVTNFGAFVDLGVHQDGLVHISQLSDRFVRDPHEVVRVGQQLKVRVVEVDLARKRIGLSAKGLN